MTRDGHPCAAPKELIDLFYQSEQDNVRLKSELIPLCDRYREALGKALLALRDGDVDALHRIFNAKQIIREVIE